MNEQIKYLAIKAGLDFDGYGYPIWGCLDEEDAKKEFLEKFADLIIKDCLGACIADIADPRDTVELKCAKKIKEHFGVTWVGLTKEERDSITDEVIGWNSCVGWEYEYACAIEAKLKEKNT